MVYAVVINLDMDNQPEEVCAELWNIIKQSMLDAGFFYIRNTFTVKLPAHEACKLAKHVMENIASHLEYYNMDLGRYIKDFYGFDVAATTDLMTAAWYENSPRNEVPEDSPA